jgi:hypothetical protein
MRDPVTTYTDDATFATVTDINDRIEDSRNELLMHLATWMPERFGAASGNVSVTYSASAEYKQIATTGGGMKKVERVNVRPTTSTDFNDNRELRVISHTELAMYSGSGLPEVAAFKGGDIYLRPVPTEDTTVIMTVVTGLTALGDSDTPTEIPGEYHQFYAYDVACRFKDEMGDPPGAIHARRQELKDAIETWFEQQAPDNKFRVHNPWVP